MPKRSNIATSVISFSIIPNFFTSLYLSIDSSNCSFVIIQSIILNYYNYTTFFHLSPPLILNGSSPLRTTGLLPC